MTTDFFQSDVDLHHLLTFIDKNVSSFSSEPIVENKHESDIFNDGDYWDIKSPASFEHAFMYIRVYKKSHQIFFIGRNDEELIRTFNEFPLHKMSETDLFSIINIINRTGEKYAIYDKEKNKIHEKKIKKGLKNNKAVKPDIFFKTIYDVVGTYKKGAWSKHGPTYITRQHFILDDCSLLEWYTLNYPLTSNLKVIINTVNINGKLNIAIKFKESDKFIVMEDIEDFEKVVDDKFLSIYLPIIKKHVGADITEVKEDDITLLRMIKI